MKREREFYGKVEDKPLTEQYLFALQDEYLEKRDEYIKNFEEWKKTKVGNKPRDESQKPWSNMLGILYEYAQSCIKKKNIGKAFTEPEDIADMALDASIVFMNTYRKNKNFKIGGSFAGLLFWKILEISSKRKRDSTYYSLNQSLSTDEDTEVSEVIQNKIENYLSTSEIFSPEELFNRQTVFELIKDVLTELDAEIGKDSKLAFIVRLYLIMMMRKPKSRHAKRLFMEQWTNDNYKYEQVIDSTIMEIQKRAEAM